MPMRADSRMFGRFVAGAAGALALAALLAASSATPAPAGGEVNLYSYRQPFLIQPLLDAFTDTTGIAVNVVYAKKGLLEKIRAAGRSNPADAVLTADIGRLDELARAGLLQPVRSPVLDGAIPTHLRHPDGLWFALTTRVRVVLASRERVRPDAIHTYADLADPRFRGRVCSRSGKHVYNVALIASIIVNEGEAGAERWLDGVKANLARKPQGNDRAQAKAIYEGVCDVALVNHYYMGNMATNERKPEQKRWAEAVRVVFPDQEGRGAHVNISGAAVIKDAKRRDAAVRLIEFLAGETAQRIYARENFEYPVKAGVPLHPLIAEWGDFRADTVSLEAIARLRSKASKLVDKVGFDQGPSS